MRRSFPLRLWWIGKVSLLPAPNTITKASRTTPPIHGTTPPIPTRGGRFTGATITPGPDSIITMIVVRRTSIPKRNPRRTSARRVLSIENVIATMTRLGQESSSCSGDVPIADPRAPAVPHRRNRAQRLVVGFLGSVTQPKRGFSAAFSVARTNSNSMLRSMSYAPLIDARFTKTAGKFNPLNRSRDEECRQSPR
jgi:hypothetical protein